MTHEEAVGFLQESGWLQDHDRQIYEQGKRDGIKWHPYPKEKPIDYIQGQIGWCKHWAKEKEKEGAEE